MQFDKIKNERTALTRTNKEEYYQNYFNKHNANLKKIWSGIKDIINIRKNLQPCLPASLTKTEF